MRTAGSTAAARYKVPSLWQPSGSGRGPVAVDPFAFYGEIIGAIIGTDPAPLCGSGGSGGDGRDRSDRLGRLGRLGWSREAVVYNMMVRLTCAYDHDGDGMLGQPLNPDGWRETGTFLKAIAILPYIRSLGANTIHLLPVQEIGRDGRRGTLGSPYAVRNPVVLDPALGEPITGLPLESQFAAFIQAARHAGLRIILELPLRTLSKDCVWIKDHPDWFYWIERGRELRPPAFTREEIRLAEEKISSGDHADLPIPSPAYREMFTDPPGAASVRLEGGRWTGTVPDGRTVIIPGAFADWPPDDHQPVWEDITYLKLYQDKRYNYPAYNTVRMYDSKLLKDDTRTETLWQELENVVARYVSEYGIDGIMIDMAHALPETLAKRIIGRVRGIKPDFAFWAEDFSRTVDQVRVGFNAVLGGQWACQHRLGDFTDMLSWIGRTPELLPHLATPETHNTPRAVTRLGGERYSRYAWTVGCFIPGIPFIHSGFELYERRPVNTGLGFTSEELESFPPGSLPLFSAHTLDWDETRGLPEWLRKPLGVRALYPECTLPEGGTEFRIVDGGNRRILAFRRSNASTGRCLLVVANTEMDKRVNFSASGVFPDPDPMDLLSGVRFSAIPGGVEGLLESGQVVVFKRSEN